MGFLVKKHIFFIIHALHAFFVDASFGFMDDFGLTA